MTRYADWLLDATHGRLHCGRPEGIARGDVSTDTRLLRAGDVFLALPGEHVDGGRYVREAIARGADCVIAGREHIGEAAAAPIAIEVDDPHAALRSIARAWRAELTAEAIGITGAAGKTTTTDLAAAILGRARATHATRHGFNTDQGVAATIAAAPEATETLIVEMGMRWPGDIARMAGLLRPTAGVITNIGPEHLDTAGTVADVARNKAELIEALPADAVCLVPADEPLLAPFLRSDLHTITHGRGGDISPRRFADGVLEIDCAGEIVEVRPGFDQPHNLDNLVTAVGLAWALGVRPEAEPDFRFSPLRWQREQIGPVELVVDCAKTSPLALGRALESFVAEPASGRRIAVLAGLPDLGVDAAHYHEAAGAHAERLGIDLLIAVGDSAREYLTGYRGAHYAVATPAEARKVIASVGRAGDRALVKGPRRAALQRILD